MAAAECPAIIGIAGSAGAFEAVHTILAALPADLPAAVVVLIHRSAQTPDYLARILQRWTRMPVVTAAEGQRIVPGGLYVAAPDRHLLGRPDRSFGYQDGERIKESSTCSGGVVIAQDFATSEHWSMPQSAIASGAVDQVLPIAEIAPALTAIVTGQSRPT